MLAVAIAVGLIGCLAALPSLYLAFLAVASSWYSQELRGFDPGSRLIVLIPAHNEEQSVGQTIRSLLNQQYPRRLFQIAVVADNCTDGTADVARSAGADEVLERHAPDLRGKGHALRWAMDRILARPDSPDALVSIDADTTAVPEFLLGLTERFERGAQVVQADYRTIGRGSNGDALREIAFVLMNWVRPAGRNVLGLGATLGGNGMLLSTEVLRRRPWSAFTATEDLEYTIDLQYDGVSVCFAGAVRVEAPTAPSEAVGAQQQRWEGGWATLVRHRLPGLLIDSLRRRSLPLLMAAIDLAVPPLGLLAALAVGTLLLSLFAAVIGATSLWFATPALAALAGIIAYVLVGLAAARAPRSAYTALLHAPSFVLKKPFSLVGTLRFDGGSWVRTERASDSPGDGGES